MKNNKKGFMMAELVIVSGIIITTLVTLYSGFNRLYINYRELSKYHNADALYAAKNMENFMIEQKKINKLLNSGNNVIDISNCSDTSIYSSGWEKTYCTQIMGGSNSIISNMYIIKKGSTISTSNALLSNYMTYFNNTVSDGSYYIIVKTASDYFGNLKLY